MKKFLGLVLAILALSSSSIIAQPARPKLVVGIMVDQMRWDYLYRFQNRYVKGGFKRLLNEGFSCENTMLSHVPTVTAVGHTGVYTGSVPSIHGIAGNNFMLNGKQVYCTDDPSVSSVGTTSKAGKMSPRNLMVNTIGDELRLATNNQAKVVGVALKDRASILPAGHNPNGAFWFDDATGNFITSTYYMNELPQWVVNFNSKRKSDVYLSQPWNTLYPKDTYTMSTADDAPYEAGVVNGIKATLPLDLPSLSKKYGYKILRSTPFGNDITLDMAMAAIEGEQLGSDDVTDLLAVSCSSTDVIGHQVGIRAVEIEDTYLRLDKKIAEFLTYLDKKVGKGNYLVFLTADHAGMDNHKYLQDQRITAGIWSEKQTKDSLNSALKVKYPQANNLVKTVMNYQVFFNTDSIEKAGLNYSEVKDFVVETLKRQPKVLYACDMEKTSMASIPADIKERIINGYNRDRSGGVQIITKPCFYNGLEKGTTHGMWNNYDAHIPLVFMGWGIKHGATTKRCNMPDIAPTVAALLHIQAPNGCIGEPIF